MKVIIQKDYDNMCEWAANHIIAAINNHKENRPFVLVSRQAPLLSAFTSA